MSNTQPCRTCPNSPKPACNDCNKCKTCVSTAVICHQVVNTLAEARKYPNSFVFIRDLKSVAHTDNDGKPLTLFLNTQVFEPGHVPGSTGYASVMVHDHLNLRTTVYDASGNHYTLQGAIS